MADDVGKAPAIQVAPGMDQYNKLVAGGFSPVEANQWRDQQTATLRSGGFTENEIDNYWGALPQNPSSPTIEKHAADNLARNQEVALKGPLDAVMAGWDSSVSGLVVNQADTTKVLPQSANLWDKMSFAIGQGAGDLPASIPGAIVGAAPGARAGAAVGALVPGAGETGLSEAAGAVIGGWGGAGAGGAAVPQATREALIAAYNSGEIHTWQDAATVAAGAGQRILKAGAIGGVSGLVGGAVGAKAVQLGASGFTGGVANATAMAVTATATASAMDGHMPDADDFIVGATIALGAHAAGASPGALRRVQSNLQSIYVKTGIPPWKAADMAKTDPVLAQEIMAQDSTGDAPASKFQQNRLVDPPPATEPKPAVVVGGKYSPDPVGTLPLIRALEGSDTNAVSTAGAVGSYQIMPATARQYGFDPAQLTDHAYSEKAATAILTDLFKRFHGDQGAVLTAYNAGPGRAIQLQKAGAGERLVATLDKRVKGGVRYSREPAQRDESFLPLETQKYLANGRRRSEGELPGSVGGGAQPPAPPPPPPPPPEEPGQPKPNPYAGDSKAAYDALDEHLAVSEKKSNWGVDPDTFYDRYVSELGPLRRLDDSQEVEGITPLEQAGRQSYGSRSRARAATRYGPVDYQTMDIDTEGPSFVKAFKQAQKDGGNSGDFSRYLVAARATALEARGVKTGFDMEAAAQVLGDAKEQAKYGNAKAAFDAANAGVLRYAKDAGLIDQETHDNLSQGTYLAFEREQEGLGNYKNLFEEIEGSDARVLDVIPNTLQNLDAIFRRADRNRVAQDIVGRAGKGGDLEGLIKRSARQPAKDLGPGQFAVWKDGKSEVWETTDPTLAGFLRGETGGMPMPGILNSMAALQRAGITSLPGFATRQILRDPLNAFIIGDGKTPPPYLSIIKGTFSAFKSDKNFQDWMAHGGAASALQEFDIDYIQRDIGTMMEKTGTWDKMWNTMRHPVDAAQWIAERLDSGQRLGYYNAEVAKGTPKSLAAAKARKNFIDFAERGTSQFANGWASITPFFRPTVLGAKQIGEAFTQRPVQTMAKISASIIAPSIMLYALNSMMDDSLPEDRKYANLPRWQKDTMFILPEVGGVRIRIPMPPVMGTVFGGTTNRFLDHLSKNDPQAFDGLLNEVWEGLMPNILPALALPVAEAVSDHNFFTGQKLVPGSVEDASGSMQYVDATSETGKAVARLLARVSGETVQMSPIVFDQFVKDWGGTFGQAVLKAVDAPLKPRAPVALTDIPFVNSFLLRNPGMSAQPIQDFYANLTEVRRAARDASLSINRANEDEMNRSLINPNAYVSASMEAMEDAISAQNAVIQGVYADKTMTDDEKRQAIDATFSDMITTAKGGNTLAQAVKNGQQ